MCRIHRKRADTEPPQLIVDDFLSLPPSILTMTFSIRYKTNTGKTLTKVNFIFPHSLNISFGDVKMKLHRKDTTHHSILAYYQITIITTTSTMDINVKVTGNTFFFTAVPYFETDEGENYPPIMKLILSVLCGPAYYPPECKEYPETYEENPSYIGCYLMHKGVEDSTGFNLELIQEKLLEINEKCQETGTSKYSSISCTKSRGNGSLIVRYNCKGKKSGVWILSSYGGITAMGMDFRNINLDIFMHLRMINSQHVITQSKNQTIKRNKRYTNGIMAYLPLPNFKQICEEKNDFLSDDDILTILNSVSTDNEFTVNLI